MAEVWFTSAVPHAHTEEVRADTAPYVEQRPYTDEDNNETTLHVLYLRGVGEFSSTDRNALADLFDTTARLFNVDNVS